MRGPNVWSIRRHKLIVMKLDLEQLEQQPTDTIPGFADRFEARFPSIYEHRCSEGVPGGFFTRVREGTWMGHVVEHIALEIQSLAGMEVGFGRTRSTYTEGVYHVVFAYMEEKAGIYAAKAAVHIAQAIIDDQPYDIAEDLQTMREIRESERLGPSTGSIVKEALNRGIPYIRLNARSLVQLGHGINQRRIQATISSLTSSIAVEIACDKEETKNQLSAASIPVARGMVCYDDEDLETVIRKIDYPIVLKPVSGNHGRGATINVTNWEDAQEALIKAKQVSRGVIVEKFVTGDDYRLLVIDNRFVAGALRTPAHVEGDGKTTIQELVDITNSDPRRGYGHEKVLTSIKIDDVTLAMLQEKGMTLESIPAKGEMIYLKRTANLSTGGTSTDVTDIVHPHNVFIAERIAKIVGLDICGIDIMSHDISVPMTENGAIVLEVNAAPGFRMHTAPTKGLPRNVAEPVIDMLFPPGAPFLVPIIAITGTNGKTTTTRLTAHIIRTAGYRVGFTTTDGIYIHNQMVEKGDCTGPVSAQVVLRDPTVEVAVLETARGGILRSGLGFAAADVGIITNLTADHLGLGDIHTVEDMARVKSVVVEAVKREGYAILNADDDLVYGLAEKLDCKVALFSMDEHNPRIKKHSKEGGLTAIVESGFITVCKGQWKIRIARVLDIPLTFGGKALFMIQNILPATLAGFVRGIKPEDLRIALETFIPSPTTTPGRLNMFNFKNFTVLIDYAHNPAGLQALGRFVEKVDATRKIGIITGVGDRRDEDIRQLGQGAAGIFDEIIVRQDKHLRGREASEIVNLLQEGIFSVNPQLPTQVIYNEIEAIETAIAHAIPGAFITVCSDVIAQAVEKIQQLRDKELEVKLTAQDIPNVGGV